MRRLTTTTFAIALTLTAIAAAPTDAATLDEVVAKHVAARGGAERWAEVSTMRVTGSFTAFSKVSPVTLTRARPDRYHIDHVLDDKRVIIGYDGERAWWDNAWMQAGAQAIPPGPDLTVLHGELHFATPLFDLDASGIEAELIGPSEVEGIPSIAIKLTREGGAEETWHLDPKTHLELARESTGSDFGNPMPQLTFFDDFREVGGLKMPYLVEAQWYTRDRVMHVENVEINFEADDELFAMPAPPGMGPFQDVAGDWTVKVEQRGRPGAPMQEAERASSIELMLGGTFVQETYTSTSGTKAMRMLSFDRDRNRYRVTRIDESAGMLAVLEGEPDENGRIVVDTTSSGTTSSAFGTEYHTRMAIAPDENGFVIETEISLDGGENWWVAARETYSR